MAYVVYSSRDGRVAVGKWLHGIYVHRWRALQVAARMDYVDACREQTRVETARRFDVGHAAWSASSARFVKEYYTSVLGLMCLSPNTSHVDMDALEIKWYLARAAYRQRVSYDSYASVRVERCDVFQA